MRKVCVEVKAKLIMTVNDDMEISQVMDEMNYEFVPEYGADIIDSEILDYEIVDSK